MRRLLGGLGSLLVLGCPSDDTVGGGTESGSTTMQDPTADPSTTPDTSTVGSASMTTLPPESSSSSEGGSVSTSNDLETTSSSTGEPDVTTTGSSSGSTTAVDSTTTSFFTTGFTTGFSSSTAGTTAGLELDNGEQCIVDNECASDMCFTLGVLGGICSECTSEDDCTWGCHQPNPLSDPPQEATCDDGTLGAGCDTDAGCMAGLVCHQVLDIMGITTINGCSECDSDADCLDQCAPVYDDALTMFEGYWECVGDGSRANGESCDLSGNGEECSSGECGDTDIMGVVNFGICSECDNDNDCGIGEACEAPTVDLDTGTITPGMCV